MARRQRLCFAELMALLSLLLCVFAVRVLFRLLVILLSARVLLEFLDLFAFSMPEFPRENEYFSFALDLVKQAGVVSCF